jgi:hypothetical protein
MGGQLNGGWATGLDSVWADTWTVPAARTERRRLENMVEMVLGAVLGCSSGVDGERGHWMLLFCNTRIGDLHASIYLCF